MAGLQNEIIAALKVKSEIDPKKEVRDRVDFLKHYLKKTGMEGYVLGISGGQDSTLAGKLAQIAVDELNEEESTDKYKFIGVRLPYGVQGDEDHAQEAMDYIQPTVRVKIDIKPAVDAAFEQFYDATGESLSDFIKGNTKARERMKAQFDLAGHYKCLVIGTDHAAEAVTGFFTKYGDGACDIAPLYGLNKRQGIALLRELDGPEFIYSKVPTADLEDEKPMQPDEESLGMTYDQIDDYLEGKEIPQEAKENVERRYRQTEHKRQLPPTVFDDWWK
ncbi:ammonia-dependent NAD(+) synthetase [Evansella sp. LMS18]|jgi:NAD+ synthase|uniref:ammonia-dependent NAD(+) synthetase n=1 Tax=Evansella sp. LMS18 TaxID=2924033 RepID=UPI0020D01625|nr:ammonia-dependent NAD(+) synthetase [Evansella sp. LMS18]UTR10716.1 ammonia-dependent NAD(+) synthetase [Evansella sp. LMS18]